MSTIIRIQILCIKEWLKKKEKRLIKNTALDVIKAVANRISERFSNVENNP